jgi:thiol-disulfide isomerase/thioredoxin
MLLVIVLAFVAAFTGKGDDGSTGPASGARSPSPLPDVTVSDLAGQAVPLRSLIGQPLLINYWYSNCPPCKEEMPALAAVAVEYAGRVRFVGINPRDDAATARSVAAERGTTYEQLLDRTNRSVDAFALTGFPSTVLVDDRGNVLAVVRSAQTAGELRALIEEHFA